MDEPFKCARCGEPFVGLCCVPCFARQMDERAVNAPPVIKLTDVLTRRKRTLTGMVQQLVDEARAEAGSVETDMAMYTE